MLNVNREIISFKNIPHIADISKRSVLLLRHSYRESLLNGNYDPGLTAEGREFAEKCGTLLKGLKNVCFGASPRKRTIQTVKAIMKGADLGENNYIAEYMQLHDTAMFSPPENLAIFIENGSLQLLLKEYFATGNAPAMINIKDFCDNLTDFLTADDFAKQNVILSTHDIILIALLSFFKVYPFAQNDWCGYVQGAFLYQDMSEKWTISYTVPDAENRELCKLFV